MAHTPGPWWLSWESDSWEDGGVSIVADQLGEVCYIDKRLSGFYQDAQWTPRTHDDQEANATLIAAAPELLAALKVAEDFISKQNELLLTAYEGGNVEWNQHCVEVWSGCVAAINKAEGRTA